MPPTTFLVLVGTFDIYGFHQGGFIMFRPIVQELLNIEQFIQRKFNKTKKSMEIGAHFWCCWKVDNE
jgi:hypothetical protein